MLTIHPYTQSLSSSKFRRTTRASLISSALVALVLLGLSLSACGGGGGGGGGDGFQGAAKVDMSISPSSIDAGDRTLVKTKLSDIHENGISLKFRYPEGLRYIANTAVLFVDDDEYEIDPNFQVTNETDGTYLVFLLAQEQFNEDLKGTVEFELEGRDEVKAGKIEVDPDVDDTQLPDSQEFDPAAPEFQPEDSATINVKG